MSSNKVGLAFVPLNQSCAWNLQVDAPMLFLLDICRPFRTVFMFTSPSRPDNLLNEAPQTKADKSIKKREWEGRRKRGYNGGMFREKNVQESFQRKTVIDPLLQAENTNGEARSIGYVHTAGLSLPHPLCFQTFTVFTSQGHLALTKTPTSRIHSKMLPSIDIPAFSLILSTHTYWLFVVVCIYSGYWIEKLNLTFFST